LPRGTTGGEGELLLHKQGAQTAGLGGMGGQLLGETGAVFSAVLK